MREEQPRAWGFERRRAPRQGCDALLDVMARRIVNGTVIDISATGLRAALPRPIYVGERHLLRVLSRHTGEQLRWGEVVWSRPLGDGVQVGMRFCEPRRMTARPNPR